MSQFVFLRSNVNLETEHRLHIPTPLTALVLSILQVPVVALPGADAFGSTQEQVSLDELSSQIRQTQMKT